MDQVFVIGRIKAPGNDVPQVSSDLTPADRWGAVTARWGVGRMHFTVDPGLCALGNPHEESPVLATANYKMSFDALRRALPGLDGWILVLDTRGINVWCAAAVINSALGRTGDSCRFVIEPKKTGRSSEPGAPKPSCC
jgi:hypothetical protein